MEEIYVGLCAVRKSGPDVFEVECPNGRAIVTPEEVRIYTPKGTYAYFTGAQGIKGKVSAVKPVKEKLYEKLKEIGFESDDRPYTPEELYMSLRYKHVLGPEENNNVEEDEELAEFRERLEKFGRAMRESEENIYRNRRETRERLLNNWP
ncbi:hypothetical protein [Thermofilum sp.]|jgi:hypothetical protein|uniref:hypothetical protein n=1 Tax=Thermofilum sp. TaxID=1961369 RepID=UPI002589DAC1|nr:hypothetical protein [Thermofilum sp.]